MKKVLCKAFGLYFKHFSELMLTLLVQLLLRAMALCPLLFLASDALSALAWLAVPAYLLIVLPVRQNVAEAVADMMQGKPLFTEKLISTRNYGKKLLRGLTGTVKMLLWSSVTIGAVTWLYALFTGAGGMDGFALIRLIGKIGKTFGTDTVGGALILLSGIAATALLILLGCAVHCGNRHAAALGDKKLVRGKRGLLIGTWLAGVLLLLPCAAIIGATLGSWAMGAVNAFIKTLKLSAMAISGTQLATMAAAVAVLLLPVLPLRTILPAVCLCDEVKE